MTDREFNKQLNSCCKRSKKTKQLDVTKIAALPEETRHEMVLYIVRHRGPVLVEFLTALDDPKWLACCGYMYTTTGKVTGLTFLHTCEHVIK